MSESVSLTRRRLLAGMAAASVPALSAEQNPGARGGPAFLPLRAGAVAPRGWLLDWSKSAARGITGHLDEYSATFREAWKGYGFPARGAYADGTGWPLEQCSYWLDGAVHLAYILDDKPLRAKVQARLDRVVEGVLKGGESFIYWRPRSVLNDTFNSWAHSHMGRALVAYYHASGKKEVLDALVKVYGDYPLPPLRETFERVGGAVNADAALETYLATGDRAILDKVLGLRKNPSYRGLVEDWSSGRLQTGHDVIFYEHSRVPALLYPWSGDRSDLAATLGALDWNDREYLLPMGLSSGEEYQAGIGSTRNVETCNVAAAAWNYLWLARITGEARYCDRIEQIFFNAAPAPVARDFKTMCYFQSANRYSTKVPGADARSLVTEERYRYTDIGCDVLCCVGNLNRVIPNYVMHMWMSAPGGGLAALLYGPSRVSAKVGRGVPVAIECRTAYPFEETIELTVHPEAAVAFPLHLRIPGWCAAPEVRVNGHSVEEAPGRTGFVRVARRWKNNDRVELRLPMAVRVRKGRETPYPQVPYFRKWRELAHFTDIHNPYATVSRGPLLYALPLADETPNRAKPGQPYNYALDLAAGEPEAKLAVVRRSAMPEVWTWPLDAPVRLEVAASRFDWRPTEPQPLPAEPIAGGEPVHVTLVPYGSTKFRVTMFPVTRRAWEA